MAAAMALGEHMQRKRDAAKMSTAAFSICLDVASQKKILRVATNQELETQNMQLEARNGELAKQLQDKTEECGHWLTEAHCYERS